MRKAGILEVVSSTPPHITCIATTDLCFDIRLEKGFVLDTMSWRKLDGTFLAGFDTRDLGSYPDRLTVLQLSYLGEILQQHCSRQPSCKLSWENKVLSTGQDKEKAWADVETPSRKRGIEVDYIVGCDGGDLKYETVYSAITAFQGRPGIINFVGANVSIGFLDFFQRPSISLTM
jgi:hypothetical protein